CFFFQAEDGIRDGHVTGVQTCALPILSRTMLPSEFDHLHDQLRGSSARSASWARRAVQQTSPPLALETVNPFSGGFWSHSKHGRSEERRVGKEATCRERRASERQQPVQ